MPYLNGLKKLVLLHNFYQNKKNILSKSLDLFTNSSFLIPKIGIELEFFLFNANLDQFIADFKDKVFPHCSLFYEIEKERGVNQIEIKTVCTSDLHRLGEEIELCKNLIEKMANQGGFTIDFSAQPNLQDCGSAMQFNLSLYDDKGNNLFFTNEQLMFEVIQSILTSLDEMMIILAPNEKDYLRFDEKLNIALHKMGKYPAPINKSFGFNNRTTAIRIPRFDRADEKRIEFRVAAANADYFLSLSAIILAIKENFNKKINNFLPIYGNAFEESYNLVRFCNNYQLAQNIFFSDNNFITKKFTQFLNSN